LQPCFITINKIHMQSLVEQRKSEQIAYKFRQQQEEGTFNIRKKEWIIRRLKAPNSEYGKQKLSLKEM